MLNQHEVGAHNHKVALKASDRLIDILDPAIQIAAKERREKQAAKRILPTCKPEARAPRKIFKGAKPSRRPHHNVPAPQHGTAAIRSAMPTPVVPNRNVNGMVVSAARVPQYQIDAKLVARYLAK